MKKIIMTMLVLSMLFASSVAFGSSAKTKKLSAEEIKIAREVKSVKAKAARALKNFRNSKTIEVATYGSMLETIDVASYEIMLEASETAEIENINSFEWGVFWDVEIYDLHKTGDSGALVVIFWNEFERIWDYATLDISELIEPGMSKNEIGVVRAWMYDELIGTTIELEGTYESKKVKFAQQISVRERFASYK